MASRHDLSDGSACGLSNAPWSLPATLTSVRLVPAFQPPRGPDLADPPCFPRARLSPGLQFHLFPQVLAMEQVQQCSRPALAPKGPQAKQSCTPRPADRPHASRPTHLPAVLGPEQHSMAGSMTTAHTTHGPVSGTEGTGRGAASPRTGASPRHLPGDPDSIAILPLARPLPHAPALLRRPLWGPCSHSRDGRGPGRGTLGTGSLPGRLRWARRSGQRRHPPPTMSTQTNSAYLSVKLQKCSFLDT